MAESKGLILGVGCKARAGKDTFGKYLRDVFLSQYNREFKTTAFAHRLKQMCLEHFNLSREQLWGNDKESVDKRYTKPFVNGSKWEKEQLFKYCIDNDLDDMYWTPREIMQELGSFYRRVDHNFWVRKLDENWKYNNCPDTIITDVRHINECEYVKEHGILIKIVRDDAADIHGMTHESETALDGKSDDYFDIVINNNGTLDDLQIAAYNAAKVIIKLEQIKEGRQYNGR